MPDNKTLEERDCGIDLSVLEEGFSTKTNSAFVVGMLKGNFEFKYTSSITMESYYHAIVSVLRKSGKKDNVKIMVPERIILKERKKLVRGVQVKVSGSFCSYLHTEKGGKQRLQLYLLAENIEIYPYETPPEYNNVVYLDGELNKAPFKRQTPSSCKAITDIFIAVKREKHTKYDYIPCIAWGKGAYMVKDLKVGDRIVLAGRIQSRMYYERDKGTNREVYEVSIFGIMDISKK